MHRSCEEMADAAVSCATLRPDYRSARSRRRRIRPVLL